MSGRVFEQKPNHRRPQGQTVLEFVLVAFLSVSAITLIWELQNWLWQIQTLRFATFFEGRYQSLDRVFDRAPDQALYQPRVAQAALRASRHSSRQRTWQRDDSLPQIQHLSPGRLRLEMNRQLDCQVFHSLSTLGTGSESGYRLPCPSSTPDSIIVTLPSWGPTAERTFLQGSKP